MKKKLISALLVAVMAVGVVFAFTACGNSSDGVIKRYMEATLSFDVDAMLDCMYFADEETKAETKKAMQSGLGEVSGLGMEYSASLTSFNYEKTADFTEAEISAYQALVKEGDTVEAGEKGKVSGKAKVKVTVAGISSEAESEFPETPVSTVKINGTWYIAL